MGMKDSKENKVSFGTFLKFNSTSPVFIQNMHIYIRSDTMKPESFEFKFDNTYKTFLIM